jgi:AmmeMemoRadiSam system protein B
MGTPGVNRTIREAMVSGIFYPDERSTLLAAVDAALVQAESEVNRNSSAKVRLILSPHAGFACTGALQAMAWLAATSRPVRRIIIIAPLHDRHQHGAYLTEFGKFDTPLGPVAIDSGACADLESSSTLFAISDTVFLEDSAIEVQLPFMRRLFPDASLVPVLVSGDSATALALARAIDVVFGQDADETLVAVSANLASSLVKADALRRSDDLLASMALNDWRGIHHVHGATAIASALAINAVTGSRFRLLGRNDSRHQNPTANNRIVHYAAAAWDGGASDA